MISIENVRYSYDKVEALKGVSLDIHEGEVLCILGANGSGKSTLAKMLCGLIIPDEGQVIVDGISTKEEDRLFDIRRRVGMVFQNPDNQIVATIVEEDVAFALENLGVEPSDMRRRIDEAMELTGITRFAKSQPHKLSGGQKQRVAIAGVLAMEPKYLVLDESTAMLDPNGRASVLSVAGRLGKEKGVTVVHITHYMEEALTADRVIIMSNGEKALEGTPFEVFKDTATLRRYSLRPPAIKMLWDKMISMGAPLPPDVLTEEQAKAVLLPLLKGKDSKAEC